MCSLRMWRCKLALCFCWQVSSIGRVKNTRGQISFGNLHGAGYRTVQLRHGTHVKRFLVHRLVAFAFLGPPSSPMLVVNHIDGNRSNNTMQNLEYVTQMENVRHSLPTRKAGCRGGKLVTARALGTRLWRTYPSMQMAADAVGVSASSVSRCCNGKALSCRGYEFQLVPDEDKPGEVWRDAVDPNTRYALSGYCISSAGRLEGPTRVRTYGRCHNGYRRIKLQSADLLVHRIMACSFLDVPASTSAPWEVNHLDGNKSNNCLTNLEVTTRRGNVLHAWKMRASREVPSRRQPVEARHLSTGRCYTFPSVTEGAQHVGCSRSSISACCRALRRSCGGYEWRYSFASEPDSAVEEDWQDVDVQGLTAAWSVQRMPARAQRKMP